MHWRAPLDESTSAAWALVRLLAVVCRPTRFAATGFDLCSHLFDRFRAAKASGCWCEFVRAYLSIRQLTVSLGRGARDDRARAYVWNTRL